MHLCILRSAAHSRSSIFAAVMARNQSNSSTAKPRKSNPDLIRPSSSVILVSPTNKILLLHRVHTSSAFPSAYVFPGGNLSAFQDGEVPAADSPTRHLDSNVYRQAAIRETFEESGILLAKRHKSDSHLITVRDSKRERIRKAIHASEQKLTSWLTEIGAEADTDGLLPFTRWITPSHVPRRFTTQMYLYFLPLTGDDNDIIESGTKIPLPTSDGGVEHTTAEFDYAANWLSLSNPTAYPPTFPTSREDIIMYPPQVFLLHILAPLLPRPLDGQRFEVEELSKQRDNVRAFLNTSQPLWGDKCICAYPIGKTEDDREILALDKPGSAELVHSGRMGDSERVFLGKFTKAGPRKAEIRWRKDIPNDQLNPVSKL